MNPFVAQSVCGEYVKAAMNPLAAAGIGAAVAAPVAGATQYYSNKRKKEYQDRTLPAFGSLSFKGGVRETLYNRPKHEPVMKQAARVETLLGAGAGAALGVIGGGLGGQALARRKGHQPLSKEDKSRYLMRNRRLGQAAGGHLEKNPDAKMSIRQPDHRGFVNSGR